MIIIKVTLLYIKILENNSNNRFKNNYSQVYDIL